MRRGASRGLTHLAITDHDRIDGALARPGRGPGRPDDHRRLGGEDPRRRPHLPLPRAADPARPAGRRGDRRRPRAGRSGRHPPPVRPLPRARSSTIPGSRRSPPSSTGSRAGTPGSSGGGGNEQAATFALEHGLPGGRRLRRPHRARGRRRVHGPGRRPVDARRAPGRARDRRDRARSGILCGTGDHPDREARPAGARQRPGAAGPTRWRGSWTGSMTDDSTRPPNDRGPGDGSGDAGARRRASRASIDELERLGELERLEALSERPDSAEDQVTADQLSLGRRLRQPRTIISIVLPIVLLVLFVRALPGFKLDELPALHPPRRTRRSCSPRSSSSTWASRCAGCAGRSSSAATGFRLGVRDSTEIIFISWLVNCLVPAKLGDVYRAYLLKINSPVSLSRTFGTVFIERILDLFAIVVLGLAAGFSSFRNGPAAAGPGRLRDRRRRRHRPRDRPPHDAQLRPADHRPAAAAAPGPRVLRPVRGGRLLGDRAARPAAPRRPHRADLGDRGDAALPRRRGARASRTSSSGSAARSSSP